MYSRAPDGEGGGVSYDSDSEGRHEQDQDENDDNDTSVPGLSPSSAVGVTPGFLHEGLLPPPDCLYEMSQLYRRHCHRQPLWLFDDAELASLPQQPEELVLSILALTTRFSESPYFERDRDRGRDHDRLEMSQRFSDAARNRVMLKIANAAVKFSTIQSLCLLSWVSFAARDTSVASLYLNLARDLLRSAGLDLRRSETQSQVQAQAQSQASPADQAGKRLFWSIYILDQLYGAHSNRTITMKGGLENLRYCVSVGDHARRALALEPPVVPEEATYHGYGDGDGDGGGNGSSSKDQGATTTTTTKDQGIWNYTVCLSAYWNEVRNYILLCASDTERAPWAPESYYTLIVSYMHELETQIPQPHRWDYKRFMAWSAEALERERPYWAPWLFFQFGYHAIYAVINHPFLLTSRSQPLKLKMPNTFWRSSSESVLLHSTWITRLITMARDKHFDLFDPFLGYAAGVAASVQLFYCCSQNDELRRSARDNLEKCKAFVERQAQVWPWCGRIKQNLDNLIHTAFGSTCLPSPAQGQTICIDTTAMLEILDYSRPRTAGPDPECPGRGLFDGSLLLRHDRAGSQVATIDISEELSEAAGRPVAPPIWRPATVPASQGDGSGGGGGGGIGSRSGNGAQTHTHTQPQSRHDLDRPLSLPTPSDAPSTTATTATVTTPGEPLHDTEVFSLPADNFSEALLQDIFHQDLQWWDMGN
ncbi:hypothetical protein A1O3_02955 [Capronia epimyces CBS 606.96]|uniref:Xylanolytic transcriptional activator regulatory domain-containing protein n=1 Tax=Capronia epimyces CBS 606.96 TaxID=1182542 RepID=W9YBM7_9EURO|nr:uncharacterized protein A1O3_02955 [Capronia epimyces CBS 606.96]EXJ89888.1 hypothetical protein A1O3_02955 [Capronia epimyces CBS 606.96]